MNKIETKPLFNCYPYSSGLYNNCGYLMIDSNQKKINLYKNNMDFLFEQNTRDAYYSICLYGDSYIVSKQNVKEKLYKINMFFKEYEEIKLNVPKEYLDTIVCVCYDATNMKILIATNYRVYSVSLDGYFIKDEYDYNNRLFNSPLFIKGIDGCCKQLPKKKSNYLITAIGICHQKKYVGIIENNNAYLLELSNNGQVINKYFIEENIIINSIITNSGFLSLLVTKNDKYNYLFVLDEPCYCCIKKGDKCLCCVEMEKCKVIESIALIEASLSSILNAEGQKIQKVIKEENNICEILKANDSINKTIVNITMLEQILCDKLKLSLKK